MDLEDSVAACGIGDKLVVDGGGDFFVNFADLVFGGSGRDVQFSEERAKNFLLFFCVLLDFILEHRKMTYC